MAQGRLLVVSTPIGNLDDLSPRAAEALVEADLVVAEDTRHTGRLLAHVGSDAQQWSLHEHNEADRAESVVDRLHAGETIALVSDAGTPAVSDPGYRLVRACVEVGVPVVAVPGPSAVLHALVTSGLPTDRFTFEGFLPRSGAARRNRLAELATEARTMVFFVSPHRAAKDLADLVGACGGDREAAVGRELTKLHEETIHGTLGELAERAEEGFRGELTIVVAGRQTGSAEPPTTGRLAQMVAALVGDDLTRRDAIKAVATDLGVPKRDVYDAVLDHRNE